MSQAVDELPRQNAVVADSPWRNPQNSVSTTLANHTDKHGRRYQSIVFLLRDPSGRFISVGMPGTENVNGYLQRLLATELEKIQRERSIDETELAKLELAGGLDTARLLRKIEHINQLLLDDEYRLDVRKSTQLLSPIAAACEGALFNQNSLLRRVSANFNAE